MSYITYKVKSGDTLSEIAAKYGVTVAAIKNANKDKIKNVNLIIAGWSLKIPVKEKEPPKVEASQPSETPPKEKTLVEKFNEAIEDIRNLQSVQDLVKELEG